MRGAWIKAALILLFIGIYFTAGRFGLSLAFMHASASAVWPPTGLALAALLLWGRRLWPAVFIGAFLVNFFPDYAWLSAIGIATGNTLEALAGAWLAHRFANGPAAFERSQTILKYCLLAAIPGTALSATFGVTTLAATGSAQWSAFWPIWMTWWLGDLVSALTVAPFLLIWMGGPWPRLDRRRLAEGTLLFLAVCAVGAIVFYGLQEVESLPLAYLTIPLLVWAGFRFGRHGAVTFTTLVSAIALVATLHGSGPFGLSDPNQSLLVLQGFIGTVTLTTLVLAAAVSESRRAHDALRESENRFRVLADNAPVLIWVNDEAGCQFVNRAYREFFGVPETRLLGYGWADFVHPDDRDGYVNSYKEAAAKALPFKAEFRGRRADGEYRWLLSTGVPRIAGGGLTGYVGSNTDITELVLARQTLARSREELEKLISERTAALRQTVADLEAFSYSLSHDMRAPIRAIQSFAEVALAEFGAKVGPPATDYVQRIIRAATRLDRLIRDVLAFSGLARQQLPIQSINVGKLLEEIIGERPQFQPPQAEITIVGPILPMMANEASLTQCLTNLLDNAVKFVKPGLQPRVRVFSRSVEGGQVRLYVEDNGIGMKPETLDRVFEMFYRAHGLEEYAGTGLGLAIVRRAAERMGGRVGVESQPGKGSTFWLQLPQGA